MAETSVTSKRRLCEAAVLALGLLALAPGLHAAARKAADGYLFRGAEYVRNEITVKLVEYDNAEAVTKAAADAGAAIAPSVVGEGRLVRTRVQAWSRLGDDTCEIHIVKPSVRYQPEILGHEMTHCLYGRWHS